MTKKRNKKEEQKQTQQQFVTAPVDQWSPALLSAINIIDNMQILGVQAEAIGKIKVNIAIINNSIVEYFKNEQVNTSDNKVTPKVK